jgi:hypothetical protein
VEATVTEIVFRGPTIHVAMTSRAGDAVVAHLAGDRFPEGLRPGDRVWATWTAEAAYEVPDVPAEGALRPGDDPVAAADPDALPAPTPSATSDHP